MQHADGRAGTGCDCETAGGDGDGSQDHVGWTQLILRNLTESGPVPVNTAVASIMPLVPWSYAVRQAGGNILRAARKKLDRLKQGGQVTVVDGVVCVVQRAASGVEKCVTALNTTGHCDTSAVWSNEATARHMMQHMKRLGWIALEDTGPVVTFIGHEPATVEAFNSQRREGRRRGAKQ